MISNIEKHRIKKLLQTGIVLVVFIVAILLGILFKLAEVYVVLYILGVK